MILQNLYSNLVNWSCSKNAKSWWKLEDCNFSLQLHLLVWRPKCIYIFLSKTCDEVMALFLFYMAVVYQGMEGKIMLMAASFVDWEHCMILITTFTFSKILRMLIWDLFFAKQYMQDYTLSSLNQQPIWFGIGL